MRRGGWIEMGSSARKHLRDAYKDTANAIGRSVPTLFLTCVSTVILGGTDDHVLLSGGKISTPFVGQTRYEIFMVIAPITILILRGYIDLQMVHLRRIEAIAGRFRLKGPITLNANNSRLLLAAGAIAVHVVPPAAITFLGHHASGLFPQYGLALYAVAIGMVLWSGYMVFERGDRGRMIGAFALPVVLCTIGAGLLHNDLKGEIGVSGQSNQCAKRFDGALAGLLTPFLRQVNLVKQEFPKRDVRRANMTCGDLEYSTWHDADLREAFLGEADLRGAEFVRANLAGTNFANSILRSAILTDANAVESNFFKAYLKGANFQGARIDEARFGEAILENTNFTGARLTHIRPYRARLSDAVFRGAEIMDSDFLYAEMIATDFRDAELLNVDFFGALLSHAAFNGTLLADVSFDDAVLACASFKGAQFNGVDFSFVAPDELYLIEIETPAAEAGITWPEGFDPAEAGRDYASSDFCKEL